MDDEQCDMETQSSSADHVCWCELSSGHDTARHACGTCGNRWINFAYYGMTDDR